MNVGALLCSELNTFPIKVEDKELAFEVFRGSNCETLTTGLESKFSGIRKG